MTYDVKPEQFQYQFEHYELTIAFDITDDGDGGPFYDAVSYTHLTLPTIYSV